MSAHTQTTGAVNAAGGSPPQRLDIRTLLRDRISFSLYIQALMRMYAANQNDELSHYEIAGIQGLPYRAWSGSGGSAGVTTTGYCTHSNVLFMPWHRPYVALYEQILCKHAVDIANGPGMPQTWKDAAANLRHPYWDWASTLTPIAQITNQTRIAILQPDGTSREVANPLYSYKFANRASSFANVDETFRQLNNLGEVHARQLKRQTFALLTRVNDWVGFGTNAAGGVSTTSSLESIHDDIHGTVGGFMGGVPYAAFDPIFWLHHCNCDRIAALWQVLHPDVWVTQSTIGARGTWTIASGSIIDAQTALTPFWNGPGPNEYWTSADVEMVTTFGYTYPELAQIASSSTPQADMLRIVTSLYGNFLLRPPITITPPIRIPIPPLPPLVAPRWPPRPMPPLRPPTPPVGPPRPPSPPFPFMPNLTEALERDLLMGPGQTVMRALSPAVFNTSFIAMTKSIGREADDKPKDDNPGERTERAGPASKEWSARVRVEKYALNESFQVCIFVVPDGITNGAGVSETDSSAWYDCDYYAGQFTAFVNGTHQDMCSNCVDQKEKHVVIEGYVPLDDALVDVAGFESVEDEVVEPYLQKNLVWRVKKMDGTVVPMRDVPSLEVSVWTTTLHFDPNDTKSVLPNWSQPKCFEDITAGQPGGCKTSVGHRSDDGSHAPSTSRA